MPTDHELITELKNWLAGQRDQIRIGHHFYQKQFLKQCIKDMEILTATAKLDDHVTALTRLGMIILYSESGIEYHFKQREPDHDPESTDYPT